MSDLGTTNARLANGVTSVDLRNLVILDVGFAELIATLGVGLFLLAGLSDRRREFATLEAIGAEPGQLRAAITGEVAVLGVSGGSPAWSQAVSSQSPCWRSSPGSSIRRPTCRSCPSGLARVILAVVLWAVAGVGLAGRRSAASRSSARCASADDLRSRQAPAEIRMKSVANATSSPDEQRDVGGHRRTPSGGPPRPSR